MKRTSARLAAITPSATLAVDTKAKALQAAGEDVIGFGAGEPDFPTPDWIVEVAVQACRDPRNHKYTPANGLPELRAAIVAKTLRDSKVSYDPSQVLVTNGGKHAVFTAFAALLDPADEVLLPAPYWTTYPEASRSRVASRCHRLPRQRRLQGHHRPARRCPDRADQGAPVRAARRTPPARCTRPDEVRAIGQWALANGVWVVTDEIYEHLVYGDSVFSSIPAQVPDLIDQTVIINGVAKTYAMTGWRVGWMIGPADIMRAANNFQSHATSNISNVAQRAALAAVSGGLDDVARMREAYARRGVLMHRLLTAIPGVELPRATGRCFCFPNVTGAAGSELRRRHADHLARARRRAPRTGQGGHRAGRGLWGTGLRPASASRPATRPSRRASTRSRPGRRADLTALDPGS